MTVVHLDLTFDLVEVAGLSRSRWCCYDKTGGDVRDRRAERAAACADEEQEVVCTVLDLD